MRPIVLPDANWEGVEPRTEALLERWLFSKGSRVRAGQPIARVVLVRATLEITAPCDGVLVRIAVPAEHTFGRGAVLADLRET